MAKRKKVKLVLRRTSPITKAAILAAAVLSVIALLALYSAIDRTQSQYGTLRERAMLLESGKSRLESNIADLGTIESALRIAMEELGLVYPDSVIVVPEN